MVVPLAEVGRGAGLDRGWMTPGKQESVPDGVGVRFLMLDIQAKRTGRQLDDLHPLGRSEGGMRIGRC